MIIPALLGWIFLLHISSNLFVKSFQIWPKYYSDTLQYNSRILVGKRYDHYLIPFRFRQKTMLWMSSFNPQTLRRDIKIPLLDVPDPTDDGKQDEHQPLVVMPLPSDHLPPELRDLNVYGMELGRPVHKLIIEDAIQRAESSPVLYRDMPAKPMYGHIAWKSNEDSLVGAIGCVSEILLQADGNGAAAMLGSGIDMGSVELEAQASGEEKGLPKTIVSAGAFRFVVKKVIQTVPFPIAVVDELPDDEPGATFSSSQPTSRIKEEGEGKDNTTGDMYTDTNPSGLIQDLFQELQAYIDEKVQEAANKQISPLEQAILQDTGIPNADPVSTEQTRVEQMAAVLIAFRTSLVDICVSPVECYFALAFLAAEIVDLKNPFRRKMLRLTNGLDRLWLVLQEVKDAVRMARARKVAKEITDATDESSKDLMVRLV